MKKTLARGFMLAALATPLMATGPSVVPSATPGPGRNRVARPHNDLLSAQRALSAAKLFLAKAPNDAAGYRSKAQQALETALADVNADIKESGLGK